jgi:hypothetical protein
MYSLYTTPSSFVIKREDGKDNILVIDRSDNGNLEIKSMYYFTVYSSSRSSTSLLTRVLPFHHKYTYCSTPLYNKKKKKKKGTKNRYFHASNTQQGMRIYPVWALGRTLKSFSV